MYTLPSNYPSIHPLRECVCLCVCKTFYRRRSSATVIGVSREFSSFFFNFKVFQLFAAVDSGRESDKTVQETGQEVKRIKS